MKIAYEIYFVFFSVETILQKCVAITRKVKTQEGLLHLIFRMLFHVMKIRGYKAVVPKMPHEPDDLELILDLLTEQDPKDQTVSLSRKVGY